MAGIYGCDISKPASNVQEAIQWLFTLAIWPLSSSRTAPP